MGKRMLLPSIGGATFLIAAILMLPAQVAYQWLPPGKVELTGVSGTLWNGQARTAVAHDVYLTKLSWTFKPLALFTGRLAFATSVETTAGHISTSLAVGFGGSLSLNNLSGRLSLAALHPAMRANGIDGVLNVQLESLVLKNGWPSEVIGSIGVGDLTASALGPAPLGNFYAKFETEDSVIVGTVGDAGAVIEVSGTIALDENRGYSLIGFVAENSQTPIVLKQALRLLGTPDENGQREFRFEGAF